MTTKKNKERVVNGYRIIGGEHSSIPPEMKEKVIQATTAALKNAPKGTTAMIVNPNDLDDKGRENLQWLMLAQMLCGQKCIQCGYEWCPDIDLGYRCLSCGEAWKGKNVNCPKCKEKGEPTWRQYHRDNPAFGAGEGKFICKRCKEEKQ